MRQPRWTLIETLNLFQVFGFVAILTIPAHQAATRALQSQGVAITWRHRVGLVIGSLIFGLILMTLGWAILFATAWIFDARGRARRAEKRPTEGR